VDENNDLLERIKEGDENAFKALFDLYGRKVYQFVSNYVKNSADAEDITQNVFIKIWQTRNRIDPSRSFKAFIFKVAYHITIDHIRSKAANEFVELSSLNDDAWTENAGADDLVIQRQLKSLYERAIDQLPPKRREIFTLSRHQGLTNKQIADHLNISVKTVENQMTAALCSMKEFFVESKIGLGLAFFLMYWNG